MQDTEAVHPALDGVLVADGEAVVDFLVGDEHAAAGHEQVARGAQRLDGARHVVHGLEDGDQVVFAGERGVGGVVAHEAHALLHAGLGGVAVGLVDRGGVLVDAVDAGERVGARDVDARPAAAACDVGDVRGRRRR